MKNMHIHALTIPAATLIAGGQKRKVRHALQSVTDQIQKSRLRRVLQSLLFDTVIVTHNTSYAKKLFLAVEFHFPRIGEFHEVLE